MPKNILMLAQHNKTEALRMASGLTLLDDAVRVMILGPLDEKDAEVQLQLESLEFADVPVERLEPQAEPDRVRIAESLCTADAVFIL